MAAIPDKDTIYIDIDDEITGIIDKLKVSESKVVALVLPKRAAVFQSIVNMKLLKRAADQSKKNLVLITSEVGLLPLAGVAGVHVAKTLTSKPEIPSPPSLDASEEQVDEDPADIGDDEVTTKTAGSKPVGQLAGLPAAANDMETLELDNDDEPAEVAAASAAAAKGRDFTPPGKKDKKLHVPNFERFRVLLVVGVLLLIALIIGLIVAINVLPKATINIKTDAANINADLNLNVSTTASSLDASTNTLPAKQEQQNKTFSEEVTTTGTENEGQKASGSVEMSAGACTSNVPASIPAGTGVTSSGNTYIMQDGASFTPTVSHGHCTYSAVDSTNGSSDIPITAQSGGSSYNTAAGSPFAVAGQSGVSATGSASGGTDDNVQVVSQSDIDNAKSKINSDSNSIKQTLQNQLEQDNYFAIPATFTAGTPTVTTSANVGDAADSVTVTEAITYNMFGVQRDDLKTLVDNSVKSQINTNKQSILSEGLDGATFSVENSTATGAQLTMSAVAEVGPELNINTIKQEVIGKKSGDVQTALETDPDVTSVSVKFSPFWVSSVPKKQSRIIINIAKPTTTQNNNANP